MPMAVGRTPVTQTTEGKGGYISAIKGQDGRLPAPPKGDLYVRDPIAARAKSIRDRVAMFKEQHRPVPEHLQKLFDELPPEATDDNLEVELVDAVTGDHVAEVELDPGQPQPSGVGSNTNVYPDELKPGHTAPAEPQPNPEPHKGSLDGPTGTVVDGVIDVEEVPLPAVTSQLVSGPVAIKPEIKFTEPAGEGSLVAQTAAISRAAGEAVAVPEVDVTKTIDPPKEPEPPKKSAAPEKPTPVAPRPPRVAKKAAPRKRA